MQFLTGKDLSEKIYDIIYDAEDYLLILSPYIKPGFYFKEAIFKTHLNNSRLHIIIVFGKNEDNIDRSFRSEDIEFFKRLPNISIVYVPTLHAKYYGNEKVSVVTSINLLDYSFKNNIEFGVSSEKKLVSLSQTPFFKSSFKKCMEIVEELGYTIFVKRPNYQSRMFFFKDYTGSDVELDIVDELIRKGSIPRKRLSEFRQEKYVNSALRGDRKDIDEFGKNFTQTAGGAKKEGFCIRCHKSIPHSTEKPMCWNCYQTWSKYKDPYYAENYCTTCGKDADTSLAKPECYNCYKAV